VLDPFCNNNTSSAIMKTLSVFVLLVGVACAAPSPQFWGGASPYRYLDSLEDFYGYGSREDFYGYGSREIVVPYSGFHPAVSPLAGGNAPYQVLYPQIGWGYGKKK
ncbi:unnamed protein product, partial [Meganyctiphanes norvegica]